MECPDFPNHAKTPRFLLAQLHLDYLTGKSRPKAITNALRSLATGSGAYEQAYHETMLRIEGQHADQSQLAKLALNWITSAKRPLTTIELRHALGVEPGESAMDEQNLPDIELIVSVCLGLVTVDNESNIIRLAHYTTQEYLQQAQQKWFRDSQHFITITCVTYLSFTAFESGACDRDEAYDQRLQQYPFYSYASHYWGHHAREESQAGHEVMEFLTQTAKLESSCQVLMRDRFGPPGHISGIHVAAYFAITEAINKTLLESPFEIDAITSLSQTPLWFACMNGNAVVVQLLVDKGADVHVADVLGRTPLWVASEEGNDAVVQMLLDKGANIDAADFFGDTPLRIATSLHENIVQLLLDKGADVNIADERGRTSLTCAVKFEHEAIIKLLLDKGADVNIADNLGRTSLSCAVKFKQETIIKLLLDNGADVNAIRPYGMTLLSFAVELGYEDIVELLLDEGADVNTDDTDGMTPLHHAIRDDQMVLSRLLLNNNANINATDESGRTPIFTAATLGLTAAVQLLLDRGANALAPTHGGRTPLYGASQYGHIDVVQLLIENDADIRTTAMGGYTPCFVASENGHFDVVELLVEKGADITANNSSGLTPLHAAAIEGHVDVIKFLLSTGKIDTRHRDSLDRTALFLASRRGQHAAVQALLENDKSLVNIKDWRGSRPLFAAFQNRHTEVVELLLAAGDKAVDDEDSLGRDVLRWARRCGYSTIIQLLGQVVGNIREPAEDDDTQAVDVDSVPFDQDSAWCDACTLTSNGPVYHCKECCGGAFCVCEQCFGAGVRCDESHEMVFGLQRLLKGWLQG